MSPAHSVYCSRCSMKDYTLKISTPDGDAFSGSALSLSVRGTEGELGGLLCVAPSGNSPEVSLLSSRISFES